VPDGNFSALHLIGAAHGGDVTSQASITHTDGSTSSVPFNLTDWAAGSGRNGNTVAVAMDHRIGGWQLTLRYSAGERKPGRR